jgi:hypothetical protein
MPTKELEERIMQRHESNRAGLVGFCSVLAISVPAVFVNTAWAEQPPPPCHPNPSTAADEAAVRGRGDIVNLPGELQDRLAQLANRPYTYLPLQVFNEADRASQLFQYYLLDSIGFEPNVFTAIMPGVNDGNVQLTATGGNCGLPTVGAVRVVLEPKPNIALASAEMRRCEMRSLPNPRAIDKPIQQINTHGLVGNSRGYPAPSEAGLRRRDARRRAAFTTVTTTAARPHGVAVALLEVR